MAHRMLSTAKPLMRHAARLGKQWVDGVGRLLLPGLWPDQAHRAASEDTEGAGTDVESPQRSASSDAEQGQESPSAPHSPRAGRSDPSVEVASPPRPRERAGVGDGANNGANNGDTNSDGELPPSSAPHIAGDIFADPQPDDITAGLAALEIVAPRQTTREAVALETAMAALAHACHQPIALEIAASATNRRFIARASDPETLSQVAWQIQARYPQALIRPLLLADDPFQRAPGETIAALELRPGAAPYLPLRTPGDRELAQEGADPLLGLLGACNAIPTDQRVVAQLALLPAPNAWSAQHQRLAVEHPLEPERTRDRWALAQTRLENAGEGPTLSLPGVLGLLALVGLVLLVWRNVQRFPLWLRQDVVAAIHQRPIHLTTAQAIWLAAWGGVVLLTLFVVVCVGAWLRGRVRAWLNRSPLYDQRLVQEKTLRVAYRARLRIVVIGADTSGHTVPPGWSMEGARGRAGQLMKSGESVVPISARADAHEGDREGELERESRPRRHPKRPHELRYGRRRPGSRPGNADTRPRKLRDTDSIIEQPQAQRRHQRQVRAQLARKRHGLLDGFISAYRQFHLATGSYFTPHWLSKRAALRLVPVNQAGQGQAIPAPRLVATCATIWRELWTRLAAAGGVSWARGLRRSPLMLSVADVAALWHLPQARDLDDLPFVEHTRARTLLAPAELTHPVDGFRIGTSTHAGHTVPVYLPPEALRRNALAIAKTGKGKSTLLCALAQASLAEELGLVLIDPHGDLAEAVLALIPGDRRDDTLLVDLGDRAYPVGLNPLDTTLFPDRDKAAANLIAVFSKIWREFWGARMESALEAALKTLYEVNVAEVAADPQHGPDRQFTLLDVTPLLTYAYFRHGLMGRVHDPALVDYWARFEAFQPRFQQEIITPVTTKLDKFANSAVARRIVGQGRSTLNMAETIQRGQVLVVKTARGVVGDDIATLIGATLLGLLQITVGEQANLAATVRRRLQVIVDEFQALSGVDFGAMLAELRKFGASFALATQALAYLDKLDPILRPTVMANVDQLFCYAMSAEDARRIEPELDDLITTSDLIALSDFHCYARLTIRGERVPIFSLALDPPDALHAAQLQRRETIRERSRERIGTAAHAVEAQLTHAVARRKGIIAQQQRDEQIQRQLPLVGEADAPPPLPSHESRRRGKHSSGRRGERQGFTAVIGEVGAEGAEGAVGADGQDDKESEVGDLRESGDPSVEAAEAADPAAPVAPADPSDIHGLTTLAAGDEPTAQRPQDDDSELSPREQYDQVTSSPPASSATNDASGNTREVTGESTTADDERSG